jgi:integrase
MRGLVAVAIRAGLCETDPTAGLQVKVRATEGHRTWSEDDIAQFEAVHPTGSRARLAFGLLLYTGQRRGDVLRMGRQHIKDGCLVVRQGKTGAPLDIHIHPDLQTILAASEADHLTFLVTAAGRPFTPSGFTNWFRYTCREAGLPHGLTPHGLRKAMCRRLAENGCSEERIKAISGHKSSRELAKYTKAVNQKRMTRDAMASIPRTKFPGGYPSSRENPFFPFSRTIAALWADGFSRRPSCFCPSTRPIAAS